MWKQMCTYFRCLAIGTDVAKSKVYEWWFNTDFLFFIYSVKEASKFICIY